MFCLDTGTNEEEEDVDAREVACSIATDIVWSGGGDFFEVVRGV